MIGFDCKKNVFIIYIYFGGEIFSRLGTDKDEVSILRKLEIICPVNNKKLYHHFFFSYHDVSELGIPILFHK